jgi:uncharacterized protein (DUF2225 family)
VDPLEQLKQQIKHYELSGIAFREDADRYHKKAEEAFRVAEQYKEAVRKLEQQ